MNKDGKLIFVYNADSNIFSAVTDYVHKIISPETYACSLCKLTYTNFKMKQDWKLFIDGLQNPKEFLHKDEFLKKYQLKQQFPGIFLEVHHTLKVLASAKEINACSAPDDLQKLLQAKLAVS